MATEPIESKKESHFWDLGSRRAVIIGGGVAAAVIGKKLLEKSGIYSHVTLVHKAPLIDATPLKLNHGPSMSEADDSAESQHPSPSPKSPRDAPPSFFRSASQQVGNLFSQMFGGKSSVNSIADSDSVDENKENKEDYLMGIDAPTCQLYVEAALAHKQISVSASEIRSMVYDADYRSEVFSSKLASLLNLGSMADSHSITEEIVNSERFKYLQPKMVFKLIANEQNKAQYLNNNIYQAQGNAIVGDIPHSEQLFYDGICVIIQEGCEDFTQFDGKINKDWVLIIHLLNKEMDHTLDADSTSIPSEIVHGLNLTIEQQQHLEFVPTFELNDGKIDDGYEELFKKWNFTKEFN